MKFSHRGAGSRGPPVAHQLYEHYMRNKQFTERMACSFYAQRATGRVYTLYVSILNDCVASCNLVCPVTLSQKSLKINTKITAVFAVLKDIITIWHRYMSSESTQWPFSADSCAPLCCVNLFLFLFCPLSSSWRLLMFDKATRLFFYVSCYAVYRLTWKIIPVSLHVHVALNLMTKIGYEVISAVMFDFVAVHRVTS